METAATKPTVKQICVWEMRPAWPGAPRPDIHQQLTVANIWHTEVYCPPFPILSSMQTEFASTHFVYSMDIINSLVTLRENLPLALPGHSLPICTRCRGLTWLDSRVLLRGEPAHPRWEGTAWLLLVPRSSSVRSHRVGSEVSQEARTKKKPSVVSASSPAKSIAGGPPSVVSSSSPARAVAGGPRSVWQRRAHGVDPWTVQLSRNLPYRRRRRTYSF